MFGSIGFTEILVISVVALVVMGPEKFPEFAKIAAKFVRDLRGYVNETKDVVAKEITPIKKELNELSRINPEDYIDKLVGDTDDEDDDDNEDEHGEDGEEFESANDPNYEYHQSYGDDTYETTPEGRPEATEEFEASDLEEDLDPTPESEDAEEPYPD